MVKNKKLFKTNLTISIILIIGFVLTAVFSYQANYQASINSIEQVSSLSAEGIYYQLSSLLSKPLNISLTMAHDKLLEDYLSKEADHLEEESYAETIAEYLKAYQIKYGFDSVFLASAASGRYYNYNGVGRILEKGDPENVWYFEMLENSKEYSLNVDNDEVSGAENKITVFVNCRILGQDSKTLGIVGVGIRMDYLKSLLSEYEKKFHVNVSLIDGDGTIQISTSYNGYEKTDWFTAYQQENLRDKILGWQDPTQNLELWNSPSQSISRSFVVTRYIPDLSWNLVVLQDTGLIVSEMRLQLYQTFFIIFLVILIVLIIITTVIRNFNRQITKLMEEKQVMFQKATEQLYDSIYELNLTKNCYVGKATEEYFASLGAGGMPFDQGLRIIAEKQIKEEYRDGYVQMFTPENAIREFESGNNHLSYDFMITQDGINYHWIRMETYLFYSNADHSIHMFSYRRNIDSEKQNEQLAITDEMTGFYTKAATQRLIQERLDQRPGRLYAFLILDIDNFKQVNDRYGHAFGDYCIVSFTQTIRRHFRENDILGRIGGDEFAVFLPVPDEAWLKDRLKQLSAALDMDCVKQDVTCHISASIGAVLSSDRLNRFELLYRCADKALYGAKQNGKNEFKIYEE